MNESDAFLPLLRPADGPNNVQRRDEITVGLNQADVDQVVRFVRQHGIQTTPQA